MTTLDNGDVMFLNDQLVSEPTPSKIAALALPLGEFDWDKCAKSGIIKANNGSKNAGNGLLPGLRTQRERRSKHDCVREALSC